MSDPVRVPVKFVKGYYSDYDNSSYDEGTIYFLTDSGKYRVFLNGQEYSVQDLSDMIVSENITVTHDVGGYSKNDVISSGTELLDVLKGILRGSISGSTFDVESRRVINMSTPSSSTDGANKGYVDSCTAVWESI